VHFINNPKKNQIGEKEIVLSPLFDWFEKDFTKTSTLIEFINQYSKTPVNVDAVVNYMDYDWNLNE